MRVVKAVGKVWAKPYPDYGDALGRHSCGKPLGNKMGYGLASLLKTKPRDGGIHAVYKLGESDNAMKEIVVSMRPDDKTHRQACRAGGGGTVYSPVLRTGAQTTRYI